MATSAQQMSGAMADAALKHGIRLAEQEKFAQAVGEMQSRVFDELQAQHADIRSTFLDAVNVVESRIRSLFAATFRSAEEVKADLDKMSTNIKSSSHEAEQVHEKVRDIFEQASLGAQELTLSQEYQAKINSDTAVAMRTELEKTRDAQLNSVVAAFSTVQTELRAISQLMSVMHDQQDLHNRWMSLAAEALQALHTNASATQQTIGQLGESQMVLLNKFNVSMNASKDNVEQLAIRISELSSTVEQNVSQMNDWGDGLTSRSIFQWLPVAGIAWAISRFSERVAAIFIFAFGEQRSCVDLGLGSSED
ncbi:MAG: hypothetical protein M1828_000655 [Chrysothrix sp. TS-e1954]|nr:MAG: hypothetical protein M1828_000655 [Chrysothrix sp. TS-e1954]